MCDAVVMACYLIICIPAKVYGALKELMVSVYLLLIEYVGVGKLVGSALQEGKNL